MARPATGSLVWKLNPSTGAEQWYARVTLADGKRPLVELDPSILHDDEKGARACALLVSNRARGIGSPGESVSSWFGRYYDMRDKRGDRSVDRSRQLFAFHIEPILGSKAMAAVTSDDLRALVRHLEAEMDKRTAFYAGTVEREKGRKPGILPGTAQNVWGEITAAFAEARTSNDDAFRVCKTNPLDGARGPRGGKDRTQAALFPSEAIALLSCRKIRLERRRVYAVAIYTGMRQSELRGLRASDVDLERMFINVRGQSKAGKRTTTKTAAGLRQIPIEPALAPLLHALVHARKAGPLLHMPAQQNCAYYVHVDVLRAGLTREEIHADDATRKPLDFHGLGRHTYLTHLAMKPGSGEYMLAAAGHTTHGVASRYIASANLLRRGRFGEPHPPLPPELYELPVDGVRVSAFVSDFGSAAATNRQKSAAPSDHAQAAYPSGEPRADDEKTAAGGGAPSNGFGSAPSPSVTPVDPDADLLALVRLATDAGDLDAAKRALAQIEARRQERAGVVDLAAERKRRGAK